MIRYKSYFSVSLKFIGYITVSLQKFTVLCRDYVFISLVLGLYAGMSMAAPSGENVTSGEVSVVRPDTKTTLINQGSQKAIINWQKFNVNVDERVKFNQPLPTSSTLNRIHDQSPSRIYGSIEANGKVILLNQSGIIFGRNARIDVGALDAAGLNIRDEDYLSNFYRYKAGKNGQDGFVINRGLIKAATGNSVNLIGKTVRNEGRIIANAGQVNLVAGRQVTVDFDGDGLLQFTVDKEVIENAEVLEDAVYNSGEIESGSILLTGSAAKNVFTNVVNNEGTIRAGRVENKNGKIRLVAKGQGSSLINTGTLEVEAQGHSDGGEIVVHAQEKVIMAENAKVFAKSNHAKGGQVKITANKVGLTGQAKVDVSGGTGGGEILVGGDYQGKNPQIANAEATYIGTDVELVADALNSGHGGKIIVWADEITRYYGHLSAQGGRFLGDGGFAEVSGKNHLIYQGSANLKASHGQFGTLLLDPRDITIATTGGIVLPNPTITFALTPTTDVIYTPASVAGFLATTDVILQANRDIIVTDPITATGNGSLTLEAVRDVFINAAIDIAGGFSANGNGTITLAADITTTNSDITLSGAVTLNTIITIKTDTGGGNISFSSTINGEQDLILTAGTGSVTVSGVVGGNVPLITFTITSANQVDVNDIRARGTQSITATNIDLNGTSYEATISGSVIYAGAVALNTTTTIRTDAGGGDISFNGAGTINGTQALTLTAGTGSVTVGGAVGGSAVLTSFTISSSGQVDVNDVTTTGIQSITGANIDLNGSSYVTTNSDITLTGAVALTTGTTISTSAGIGNITFNGAGTINGAQDLTLTAGTGNVTVGGAVGGTTPLSDITIVSSNGVTFSDAVSANTLALTDTTGTIAVQGNLTISTLTTANQDYSLSFTGTANSIANAVIFNNTGTLTLGDGGDSIAFVGGVTARSLSNISLGATVTSAGTAGIVLGDADTPVTVGFNIVVGGAGTGTIAMGDIILSDGVTLTVGTEIANVVNLDAISGTVSGASSNLVVNSTGVVTIAGAIGTDIGTVTITGGQVQINAVTAGGDVNITSVNADISLQANITASGQAITINSFGNIVTANAISINGSSINIGVDSNNSQSVTLNLTNMTLNAGTTITLNGGNDNNDTLSVQDLVSTWTITGTNSGTLGNSNITPSAAFSDFAILMGAASQNDMFIFQGNGNITGNIDGRGHSTRDVVDIAAVTGVQTVNIGSSNINISTINDAITNVEHVIGDNSNDVLQGNGTFDMSSLNAGELNGITFAGMPNLDAQDNNGVLDIADISGANTVILQDQTGLQGVIDGTYRGMVTFIGDDTADIWQSDVAGDFVITGNNDGTFSVDSQVFNFNNFISLTGSSGDDSYIFNNGGSISGAINDNDGNDTYTFNNAGSITGTGDINDNGGNDSYIFNNGGSISGDINDNGGEDSLTGDNDGNTFVVTGNNQGRLDIKIGGNWFGIENINGGDGDDSITFNSGSSLSGLLDGGDGNDSATYNNGQTVTLYSSDQASLNGVGAIKNVENLDMNNSGVLVGFSMASDNEVRWVLFSSSDGEVTDGNAVNDTIVSFSGVPEINVVQNTAGMLVNSFRTDYVGSGVSFSGVINFTANSNAVWYYSPGEELTTGLVVGSGFLTIVRASAYDTLSNDTSSPDITITNDATDPNALILPDFIGSDPDNPSYTGHLIIGGQTGNVIGNDITGRQLNPLNREVYYLLLANNDDVVIATTSMNINEMITTGGSLTLFAFNISLSSNITSGGMVNFASFEDSTNAQGATQQGNINIVGSNITLIAAGVSGRPSVTFIAVDQIVNASNLVLDIAGAEVDVASRNTQVQFSPRSVSTDITTDPDLIDFLAAELSDNVFNVISGVINAITFQVVGISTSFSTNPAASLVGLGAVVFIDLSLFDEELTLYSSIGSGVALSLAQCEEEEGCAPNVSTEELDNIINALETKIEELEALLLQETSKRRKSKIEELLAGYREELNNYIAYEDELKEFYAAEEELEDDFSEELFEQQELVQEEIQKLAKILGVVQSRIQWLESLKTNSDELKKLSDVLNINISPERLDKIINATQTELDLIKDKIQGVNKGTRSHAPIFQVNNWDIGDMLEIAHLNDISTADLLTKNHLSKMLF